MVLREMTLLFLHPKTLLCCWSHFPSRLELSLATPALLMHPYHSVPRAEIPVRHVFASQDSKNRCVSTPLCSDPTETKATAACTDSIPPPESAQPYQPLPVNYGMFVPPALPPPPVPLRTVPKTLQILMFYTF